MRKKVFFYDIGGVLVRVDLHKAFDKFSRSGGRPAPELREICDRSGIFPLYEAGKLSSLEFYDKFKGMTGIRMSFEEFSRAWCEIFTENPRETSRLLRLKKICRVFLLSNTNELHYSYLTANFPVLGQVDGAVLSYEAGACKPGKEIYLAALNMAGARPEECVFVDDIKANADAAGALGIRAIQYKEANPKSKAPNPK